MKKVFIIFIMVILLIGALWLRSNQSVGKATDYKNEGINEKINFTIAEKFAKKYDRPAANFVIEVINQTQLYAKGNVSFIDEPGGGIWFAAKTDDSWALAFDGNGIMSCDIAEKYLFPNEMVPSCIDTENNNSLKTR